VRAPIADCQLTIFDWRVSERMIFNRQSKIGNNTALIPTASPGGEGRNPAALQI